jgi:DNA helicase-2/ATP-dependent DNA helicase PcrA
MAVTSLPKAFTQAYERLNEAQRRAVDTIEGPVMVLAGPGTGKTQVLAVRIANILRQTDTQPSSILALTFTESAAATMRQRLVSLIGAAGYYVQITTFHAFCSSVIQHHPEYFPIQRGSQALTEIEKFQLFEQLLQETTLDALKPLNRPLFYVREVIKAISDLKREGVSPEQFAMIIDREVAFLDTNQEELSKAQITKQQKLIAKWQELLVLYQTYQHQLTERLRYDFDDMIMLVKSGFEQQPDLLLEYQEQLHYFLVDEYQDTNSAQNQVVAQLASYWGEQANLFVVGDPHQAIYRFQGASVENVLSFAQQYPQTAVIHLEIGYRCPQQIYDVAHHLISHNQVEEAVEQNLALGGQLAASSVKLRSAQSHTENTLPKVVVTEASSQIAELIDVINTIKQLLKADVSPAQIAVLFRHNRDATLVQELCTAEQLPFSLAVGQNALEKLLVQKVLMILSVIVELQQGGTPDTFYELLQYEWFELPAELPMKLVWVAQQSKKSLWQLLREGWEANSTLFTKIGITQIDVAAVQQVQELLIGWIKLDSNQLVSFTLETIFEQSGLLRWITKQPNQFELLQQLTSLFEHVQGLVTQDKQLKLAGLLHQIETMLNQGIALPLAEFSSDVPAITLSTVHRAKGQEWDYVFVVHVYDGKWGNGKERNLLPLPTGILQQALSDVVDKNQDDRRLMYVALTRAAKQVYVSYPQQLQGLGRQQTVVPSLFIHEVEGGNGHGDSHTDFESSVEQVLQTKRQVVLTEEQLNDSIEKKLRPPTPPTTAEQRQFIQSIVDELKLSVTGLNVYLRDPQQFLEQMVLRVPRSKAEPLAFGTAMHSALELLGKTAQQQGALPPLEHIIRRFETSLQQELLAEDQLRRRLVHGTQLLSEYYQYLNNDHQFDPTKLVFIERFFGSGSQAVYVDDVPLIGRIDRIDWIDPIIKTARVVDYKTGKPKSVNVIEGAVASEPLSERELALPSSIRGPLKRQLLFYKLLADLDPTFKPKVTEGMFSFLEPNPSGKIVERRFELRDEDVEELKKLIKEVMTEIRALAFLETT